MNTPSDLEVQFKPDSGKAVIEGKTTIPFQSFVTLVLQRKVMTLMKAWGKHAVIIDSELLTSMASAPQESRENVQNLILVTLVTGALGGVGVFAAIQALLSFLHVGLTWKEQLLIAGSILMLAVLLGVAMKLRKLPRGEKLTETMEGIAGLLK